MSETTQGTVKWFNNSKGYGFITPSDGGKDLFVHMSEIKMEGFKTLRDGQSVDFEVGSSEKGPCAVNVVPQ
ncbi:MAG TPA: cold-shock protein [Candidatus Marinimicrobia bacterium]|mgnify:FL=1|nr:cold-shock protein [Candidatus Neomarinimicrobiota bacterium]